MTFNRWILGSLALVGYLLSTCLVSVAETDYVIISQFGRPTRVIEQAGLAFKLPAPVQVATRVDKRVQLLSLPAMEYGTRDRRNVVVESYVVWRVSDPMRYLTSVRSQDIAELRLEAMTNAEVGAAVASVQVNRIFSEDAQEHAVAELFAKVSESSTQQAADELGIEILSVRPNRFGFPVQNLQAIYKRMESEWERLAKQYRAEGEEAASKILAETEREVRELTAKAYRDAQLMRGESEAEAARLYNEAFASHQQYYQFTRSMEAYGKIFDEQTQLILATDTPLFDALLNPPLVEAQ
ncbi:protease modulator HflC [Aliagarivorans marinus]|uniref:protease modulator HflC n=1 Tax=Aliagarivorans marinus TaxID=561965 RepID=UPI000407D073|nr:protease modulator HflC [Aliagarivorans marinus]